MSLWMQIGGTFGSWRWDFFHTLWLYLAAQVLRARVKS